MAVTTQTWIELTIELDGVEYNCQVIDAEHVPPLWQGAVTTTETACPDGVVHEDTGSLQPGSLRGSAFADTTDAGITWALRTAAETKAEMTYRIVHFPELGPTGAVEETGRCKVNTFSYGSFAKPGTAKHPIDLILLDSSGPTRPTAAA